MPVCLRGEFVPQRLRVGAVPGFPLRRRLLRALRVQAFQLAQPGFERVALGLERRQLFALHIAPARQVAELYIPVVPELFRKLAIGQRAIPKNVL